MELEKNEQMSSLTSLFKWLSFITLSVAIIWLNRDMTTYTASKFDSIDRVCSYLNEQGIQTRKSNNPDITGAICLSGYIEIDGNNRNKLKNNIAYYVEGKNNEIKRLKSVINFNQPPSIISEKAAQDAFETLLTKSFSISTLTGLEAAIKERNSAEWELKDQQGKQLANVRLIYDKWPNAGYEFRFIIE